MDLAILKISHPLCRYTGVTRTGSRSGRLPLRYHIWPFHLPVKNGQRPGERQYWDSVSKHICDPFHRMFLNKHYAQASVAFLRAGRNREATICDAYLRREKARLISTTSSAARIQAFVAAANAFIDCARDSLCKVNERLAYYGTAGECYLEARDPKSAGDNHMIAEKYAAAACAYLEGEYIDEVVEVMTRHRDAFDGGLLERLTIAARLHYFKVRFKSRVVSKCL